MSFDHFPIWGVKSTRVVFVKGWKSIGEYQETEARMIESVLRDNGIAVLLRQVDYALPVIMGSGGRMEVFVPEDLYDEALRILEGKDKEG